MHDMIGQQDLDIHSRKHNPKNVSDLPTLIMSDPTNLLGFDAVATPTWDGMSEEH